jgi:uncharacterized protein
MANTATVAAAQRSDRTPTRPPVIDCDVHNEFRNLKEDVLPFLDHEWQHYITNKGFGGLSLRPYAAWQGQDRYDTVQKDGTRTGAHYEVVRDQHLDVWNIEYAVLTGPVPGLAVNYLPQHEWATALSKAMNDYAIVNWFERDERIKGSIVVAAQAPKTAAREIDRCGEHPDVVQVVLPTRSPGGVPWCDEKYDPVWEACVRNDLVVGFHLTAAAGDVAPPTTAGWPRSYAESHVGVSIAPQSELIGLICRGTFQKHPGLRMVWIENGFGWFPSLMWRLDRHWKELRAELPWLQRKPSEYVRDAVRFTTQPMEEPAKPEHLPQLIDMMGSDEYLLFSSDFPHWNFDSPESVLPEKLIGRELQAKILAGNARDFYQLDSRKS